MAGYFISFEGIDFSGKSVQCRRLREALEAAGQSVVAIREPGGTAISESVRRILLDANHTAMTARAEVLLYAAARAQIVDEIIRPALAKNQIVLADRFMDSTVAYQGHGRQLDLEFVRRIIAFAVNGTVPSLTFFLDVSIAAADERRRSSGRVADRLEGEAAAFHQRVRDGYLAMAREAPERFVIIDGALTEDRVASAVRRAVSERLGIQL